MTKTQKGFAHPFVLLFLVVVLAVVGFAGWRVYKTKHASQGTLYQPTRSVSEAEQQGKRFSNGTCAGTEVRKLDHLPIDAADVTRVLPYGGTVGAHVMPISHAYIWPGEFNSPRDSSNVYAMADSTLYSIGSRSINVDTGQAKKTEYSLNFSVSCVEFYYYDLMTSLTPELQRQLDAHPGASSAGNLVNVNIKVKSGQLLGKIGGQTLDYAVWDFTKNVTGMIVPEHYQSDFPRIHLVSPFEYTTDDVKRTLLAKNLRTAEPVEGKVDYDIDGKLIGGWFQEGTNFYGGQDQSRYWAGHLAILPNELDPTFMGVSIGTWQAHEEGQFGIARDAPDPRTIGVESGVVTYDLYNVDFTLADGSHWDRMTFAQGVKATTGTGPIKGCAVFQMVETRKLKAEFFPGKACSSVNDFTTGAKIYTR